MDWLIKYSDGDDIIEAKVSTKKSTKKLKRTKMKTSAINTKKRHKNFSDVSLIRNNSRVSLVTDPVTRRRVQDIQPLARTMIVQVPAIRCQVRTSVTRQKCKGIAFHEGSPFYILSLFGANKCFAKNNITQERVWVYVQDRGVIQVLWEDVQERMVDPVPDKVCAKVTCCGNVRLVPQKMGTRASSDTKMTMCFRLDFGVASETNRWLWVEESFLLGVGGHFVTVRQEEEEEEKEENKEIEEEDKKGYRYEDEIVAAEILATLSTTLRQTTTIKMN